MALISESTRNKLLTGAVIVGAGEKIVDLLTRGRVTQAEGRILSAIFKKAGRVAISAVPRAVGTARILAMRHPYVAGAAIIYVGVTEREKIRTLLEQGYDIVEERLPTPSLPPMPSPGIPSPSIPGVEDIILGGPGQMIPRLRPGIRKPSAFNRAVSAGMKAVKKSTSYGGKGKIRPAKKAFALVTKLASAKKKKKKAPKSGIRRRIWNAMKGLR